MGDYFRMLRRSTGPSPSSGGAVGAAVNIDSKSQNSDYGSFCNTPNCDTVTTGGATTTTAKEGARGRSGGGTSPPTSGGQPAPDDDDDKEEDNSIMVRGMLKDNELLCAVLS